MSRKPDYVLKGMNKVTDEKVQKLGAAWSNEDGSISLVIDRFVVLPTDSAWVYTLFPIKP